ncbi:MAG: hypothetical protein KAS07_00440 [Candidatus Pacebacteria bacterium]|nr:hypothetical protein [Candidatus Paceibacterota bacterium]
MREVRPLSFLFCVPSSAIAQTERSQNALETETMEEEQPTSQTQEDKISEYRNANMTVDVPVNCKNLFQLILESDDKCLPLREVGYTGYSYQASCPGKKVPDICPLSY